MWWNERSEILSRGLDGRARVMRDPERVERGGWRVSRLRRYFGWPNWSEV